MIFEELTKERQEEVIEEHREVNVEFDWWEYSLENICERIKEKVDIDLNGGNLMFDFFSKGHSGVWIDSSLLLSSFSYKYPNLEDLNISEEFGVWAYMGLRRNDTDDVVELYEDDEERDDLTTLLQDKQDEQDKRKIEDDLNIVLDMFAEGYNSLYKEYNYLTSDEGIIENFKVNEMEFEDD